MAHKTRQNRKANEACRREAAQRQRPIDPADRGPVQVVDKGPAPTYKDHNEAPSRRLSGKEKRNILRTFGRIFFPGV